MNRPIASIKTIDREELRDKLARGDRLKLVLSLGEWAFRAKRIPARSTSNSRWAVCSC